MLDLPVFITLCIIAVGANCYAVPRLYANSQLVNDPAAYRASRLSATIKAVLLSLAACAVGSYMAPRVGLATPFLNSLLQLDQPHVALLAQLWPAIVNSLLILLVLALLQLLFVRRYLSTTGPDFSAPTGARILSEGVIEEIVYRWGLMSALARILEREMAMDPSQAVMIAIVVAALASSLSHVADLARLKFDRLNMAVLAVLALHFWGALCYGWLFWEYGLTAAILCHALVTYIVMKGRELNDFFIVFEDPTDRF